MEDLADYEMPFLPFLTCDLPYKLNEQEECEVEELMGGGRFDCSNAGKRNNNTCLEAVQRLLDVTCPASNYISKLKADGIAECTLKEDIPGHWVGYPVCPTGTTTHVDYFTVDNQGRPLVTCAIKLTVQGQTSCPNNSVPYKDYLNNTANDPPVQFQSDFGDPVRTCVELMVLEPGPHCSNLNDIAFVVKEDMSNLMESAGFIGDLGILQPQQVSSDRTAMGDSANHQPKVICLRQRKAKPRFGCRQGFKLTAEKKCKSKAHRQFILDCPPGYVLDKAYLAHTQHYNKPHAMCISKLPTTTDYLCPERFLPNRRNGQCVEVVFQQPLYSPSDVVIETLFPGVIDVLLESKFPFLNIIIEEYEASESKTISKASS
eukprot:Platyproteum_vivax@DN8509_c0_g1_i1.p1